MTLSCQHAALMSTMTCKETLTSFLELLQYPLERSAKNHFFLSIYFLCTKQKLLSKILIFYIWFLGCFNLSLFLFLFLLLILLSFKLCLLCMWCQCDMCQLVVNPTDTYLTTLLIHSQLTPAFSCVHVCVRVGVRVYVQTDMCAGVSVSSALSQSLCS